MSLENIQKRLQKYMTKVGLNEGNRYHKTNEVNDIIGAGKSLLSGGEE